MIEKLNQMTNREEAKTLITGLKKTELVKLAKDTKVYISNGDSKTTIIEKIIESTIGLKLRQQAFANLDLSYKIKKYKTL